MHKRALPLFALLVTLIGVTAVSAHAQSPRKVTLEASVPFAFVVGNHTFSAGNYIFEMATGSPTTSDSVAVLVVRNHERKLYTAVVTDVTADETLPAAHKLEFVRSGDHVFLSKVWRQGNPAGLTIHTAPSAPVPEDWQESEVLTVDAQPVMGGA